MLLVNGRFRCPALLMLSSDLRVLALWEHRVTCLPRQNPSTQNSRLSWSLTVAALQGCLPVKCPSLHYLERGQAQDSRPGFSSSRAIRPEESGQRLRTEVDNFLHPPFSSLANVDVVESMHNYKEGLEVGFKYSRLSKLFESNFD